MSFKIISPYELTDNSFKLIGKDWGLVTANTDSKVNMMTISWGGLGIMWNKPVTFSFIRPQRYTYDFLNQDEYFSICFMPDEYRKELMFCGTKSGREIDKVKECGLTIINDKTAPYFEESKIVLICKKLYAQNMNADSVIDNSVLKNYAEDGSDYHRMFVSEITEVLVKE